MSDHLKKQMTIFLAAARTTKKNPLGPHGERLCVVPPPRTSPGASALQASACRPGPPRRAELGRAAGGPPRPAPTHPAPGTAGPAPSRPPTARARGWGGGQAFTTSFNHMVELEPVPSFQAQDGKKLLLEKNGVNFQAPK